MSVTIFQSSVAPSIQQAARALNEAGQLDRLVTSVRDDPSSAPQRIAGVVGRLVGRDLSSRFRRRTITEVPLNKVETHPWGELLRLSVASLDKGGRLADYVWEHVEIAFDRTVARSLREGLTGVYGFEHASLHTFERAKQLGIKVIYEIPSPDTLLVEQILEAELEKFPELRTAYVRYIEKQKDRRTARRRAEWRLADTVIVSSEYTKRSFVSAGLDVGRVRIVPLGAPATIPRSEALHTRAGENTKPLFIWAGNFSMRKGAHYLLEAWRSGGLGRHARLKVYGTIALPDRVIHPVPEGIEFVGSIPHNELMERYQEGDALMFPTLCDGFGMVATEAWSRGLPVITTSSAGVSDQVENGKNGLLIRAGDADAIAGAIEWCISHRGELRAMREQALETAARWQWSDYRRMLTDVLRSEGAFGPGK